MAPTKLAVRAQRKYAHKAIFTCCLTSDQQTGSLVEPEPVLAQPKVTKVPKPAKNLLDYVSFQKTVHAHRSHSPKEKQKEKEVKKVARVMVERYSPTRSGILALVTASSAELPSTSSAYQEPGPSTSRDLQKSVSSRPTAKKTRVTITKAKNIKNTDKSLTLRSRTIIRSNEPKEKKNKQPRKILPSVSRLTSDTEDNRPLTYFAENKARKKTNTLKTSKLLKKTRRAITRSKDVGVKSKDKPAKSGKRVNRKAPEKKKVLTRSQAKTTKKQTSSASPVQQEKQNTDTINDIFSSDNWTVKFTDEWENPTVLKEEDDISIHDAGAIQSEESATNAEQPYSLAAFVINLFNWKDTELEAEASVSGRGDDNTHNPDTRIQEWLVTNNATNNASQDFSFKVPQPPRRQNVPYAPSVASTSVIQDLPLDERNRRKTCPSWNYAAFSEINTRHDIIGTFCGECTRCKIMFTIKDPTIIQSLVREDSPFESLKSILTKTGLKILESIMTIKNNISHNASLTPRQTSILAQVIGILTESNSQIPNANPLRRPHEQAGSALETASVDQMEPALSKRARLSKRTMSITSLATELDVDSTCLKFYPSPAEFNEGPIRYALKKCKDVSFCGIGLLHNLIPDSSSTNMETELNFKINNQYLHRMLKRWSDSTRELTAIRSIQDPKIQRSPLYEGLEVDLVKLYHTVQEEGGIEACQNDQEKWKNVAQKMHLVRRSTKLENIYLKYLLAYNSLTKDEKEKAIYEVQKCWEAREMIAEVRSQQPLWRQEQMSSGARLGQVEVATYLETVCSEVEECFTPGRSINMAGFKKLAQQILLNHFPQDSNPSVDEVEKKYWEIVVAAESHVCVHAASVDATEHRVGFAKITEDQLTEEPWNLKGLCSNPSNLLSYLGPSPGVSSTTMHYGMAFTTSPWHMDPTSVPWIEYLHEGGPKIWYSISADQEKKFRFAAESLYPFAVQNKDIWLPCDIIMVPPKFLRSFGVNVKRHVQYEGEFVIVFPNTYCACIDTGFTISEGVYFAPQNWINKIEPIFENLRNNCEPSLFSMEQLLISMAKHKRTPHSLLNRVHAVLGPILRNERCLRQRMAARGIELITPEVFLEQNDRATSSSWQIQKSGECAYCRRHLYLSRVVGLVGNGVCSMHGVSLFESAVARHEQLANVYCILLVVGVPGNGVYSMHGVSLFESAVARHEQLANVYCILCFGAKSTSNCFFLANNKVRRMCLLPASRLPVQGCRSPRE